MTRWSANLWSSFRCLAGQQPTGRHVIVPLVTDLPVAISLTCLSQTHQLASQLPTGPCFVDPLVSNQLVAILMTCWSPTNWLLFR